MIIRISLTSWNKRINNVQTTISSLLNQSLKPTSIELNLSLEEFPNKENDLPKDLYNFIKYNDTIEINWVNKNTKTFKKIIPVIEKYLGQKYILLSVDDDRIYLYNYIEKMVQELGLFDSYCPFNSMVIGLSMIYNSLIFDDSFCKKIPEELIQTGVDDTYISYYLIHKNAKIKFGYNNDIQKSMLLYNEFEPLHDYYNQNNRIKNADNISRKIWDINNTNLHI